MLTPSFCLRGLSIHDILTWFFGEATGRFPGYNTVTPAGAWVVDFLSVVLPYCRPCQGFISKRY